jgi:hypothetical protein
MMYKNTAAVFSTPQAAAGLPHAEFLLVFFSFLLKKNWKRMVIFLRALSRPALSLGLRHALHGDLSHASTGEGF